MENLLKDLHFALRTLRKQPAFTATVVATLALAIGASTAIFSVVESTLLRPLPFRTPDRLTFLWGVAGPQRSVRGGSFIEVQDWARLNRTFEDIAIYDETRLSLRTPEGSERVEAEMVSASYFPMLGASAARGRVFSADEDRVPDANAVVVISDRMWNAKFSRDPNIIGKTLTLNEQPFTVVGVMPTGFAGISFNTDVWYPSMMVRVDGPLDLGERGNRWLGAIGRLRAGVTTEQAQADLDRVAKQLEHDFPETNKERGVQLFSLRDSFLGDTRTLVIAVFAAVGLLLLIACANVIGLQLVRAAARRREIALRMAIGADRGRLVQQLVVEGLVLAVASAAVGMLVAYWGLQGLTLLAPPGVLPSYAAPSINLWAFAFALSVAIGCGFVFGLVPALRGSRVDLVDSLKEGSRGSADGFGRSGRLGAQQLLVVGETAVALVLLVCAGLYVRSLKHQLDVQPGFVADGLVRVRVAAPPRYTLEMRTQLVEQLQQRLGAIPSVRGVAISSDMPLSGVESASPIHVPHVNQTLRHYRHVVAPDFFSVLGISLRSGRSFTSADRAGATAVVIVNESMARRFWPNESPLGKRLRVGDAGGNELTIVGVVADVRYRDLTTPLATTEPDIYYPLAQRPAGALQIALRSDGASENLTSAVRRELLAVDPAIPVFGIQSMESMLAQQTARSRFASSVLTVFGVAALILTAVGLYGVLAFLVGLRRREIGIRLALGATNNRVLGSVIGHGLRLVMFGLAIGTAAAALTTQLIATQLYDVGAHDPVVFVSIPLLLVGVAALAAAIPARRAARVDPQVALRSD
ncbi:MAG TPA: ABC transporter permease [Gemmatimonadaceae bacterium]